MAAPKRLTSNTAALGSEAERTGRVPVEGREESR
jgi:hypothetical protein